MTAVVVYESAFNQIASITDLLSHTTAFPHESHGNLTSVTDPRGGATGYTYNNMDRLQQRTDPLTMTESRSYDLNGNLTQFTDRKQQETTVVYDEFDRPSQVTYDDNSTTTNTYDLADRLTQVVDSISGTISLTRDNLDRLTQETTPQGTVGYTYDAAGRTATMTITGQTEIAYSYDNANRLTQITQGNSVTGFGYDAAGRRTSLTLPNAVVVAYTYDNAGQLTGIAYSTGGTPLGDLAYEYDAAGNRISIGGSFARTGLPQALASAVYDAANRLTQWGNTTLTYDDNGNLTSDGVNAFVWDPRDRMASMTGATFQYDAFGRQIGKTVGGIATQFLYDGLNVAQELGDSPATLLTGLGFDEVFTRTDANGARFPLPDGLNSSLALTDANGAVQTSYTYEPFGTTAGTGTPNANPFQYTGRENDATGLYYNRARYYSPTFQRFISEDPGEFLAGDVNLYGYAWGDPLSYADALGLSPQGGKCVPPCGPDGYRDPTAEETMKLLAMAREQKGTPYKWGGRTPEGFDCAGFVCYAIRNAINSAFPFATADSIPTNPGIRPLLPGESQAPGDVAVFPGHTGIWDPGTYGDGSHYLLNRLRGYAAFPPAQPGASAMMEVL